MQKKLTSTALTAVNGIPSGSNAGASLRGPRSGTTDLNSEDNEYMIAVRSTAGSGAMTCKVGVWGYVAELDLWFRFAVLNKAADGSPQDIAETSVAGDDKIYYAERILGVRHFDRLYVELIAIGGASTAVDFYAFTRTPPRGNSV